MPRPSKKRATRHGMFIYCKTEEKKRIRAVAARKGLTLSEYILRATMPRVEADERRLHPRK